MPQIFISLDTFVCNENFFADDTSTFKKRNQFVEIKQYNNIEQSELLSNLTLRSRNKNSEKERIKSGSAKCSMIDDRKNGLCLPTESLGVVG